MIFDYQLSQLPSKPDWFDSSLSNIASIGGFPLFRVVDGQRELHWRNGGWSLKHLVKHPTFSPFVKKNGMMRAVGIKAWVVEVLIHPKEIDYEEWCANRYKEYKSFGKDIFIDVLGPYPDKGLYVYCWALTDNEGFPVSPGTYHLEKLKEKFYKTSCDTETLDMAIKRIAKETEEEEKEAARKIADNVYQSLGISARKLHNAAISKPIKQKI